MTEAIISLINRSKPDEFLALVLIFGGGVLVAIIAILAHYVFDYRRRETEAALKHEMIARGMSADEIERVLGAKSTTRDKS